MTANYSGRIIDIYADGHIIISIYDSELHRCIKFVLSKSTDEYYHVDCYYHEYKKLDEDEKFIFAFSGIISSSLSNDEMTAELMHMYNQQHVATVATVATDATDVSDATYVSDVSDDEMDVEPEEYNDVNMEFETSSKKEDYTVDTTIASFRPASSSIFNMNIFARPNIPTVEPTPSTDSSSDVVQASSATNEPAPLVETYSHIFGIRRQMPSIPPIEQSQESSSNANHYNSDEEEAANSEPKPKNARFN